MDWLYVLGVAVGLSMDALAVSIAAAMSVGRVTPGHVFRLGFHFGLFQFLMPVLGWLLGSSVSKLIGDYDHWVAFGLLSAVGIKMLWEAWSTEDRQSRADPSRGIMLITLSIATSIDALAVGLSMALLDVAIWGPSVVIGLVTGLLSALGVIFGSRLGTRWGHAAEVLGGCVLIAIGLRILFTHLH